MGILTSSLGFVILCVYNNGTLVNRPILHFTSEGEGHVVTTSQHLSLLMLHDNLQIRRPHNILFVVFVIIYLKLYFVYVLFLF